jgi:hypothetical protein
MKGLKLFLLAFLLASTFASAGVYAAEQKASGCASVDVMSNYIWRGQKISNSWVIQPSVGITYGVFGANIWANYDSDSKIDEGDGHGEFTETDITLNYTRDRKSTRLNSSHNSESRMPSSA